MDVDLSKTLKRCLSVPIINNLPSQQPLATSSINQHICREQLNKQQQQQLHLQQSIAKMTSTTVPQSSNPPSREVSPAPVFNIFAPRARRYSASFSPLGASCTGPRLTPRVSQLRQEECADLNTREVNHEREVHSAIQMSQSWEDLTLVAENWSCKSDELSNPLQVALPSGISSCSSPSPTSNRAGPRLPYGLSPSPTRRTFATRRSMSPIAMRPSQLGPVKRKFELDDTSNWNLYAPPVKKIFTESRGSSPICQSPSSICPSPDSGTYDGRITPKLFISKLCTNNNTNSSACSSPMAASPGIDAGIDIQSNGSVSSPATTTCSSTGSEPMCVTPFENLSEENVATITDNKKPSPMVDTDDGTLMVDIKSETSSISTDSTASNPINNEIPKQTFLNKLPTNQHYDPLSATIHEHVKHSRADDKSMPVDETPPVTLAKSSNILKPNSINLEPNI